MPRPRSRRGWSRSAPGPTWSSSWATTSTGAAARTCSRPASTRSTAPAGAEGRAHPRRAGQPRREGMPAVGAMRGRAAPDLRGRAGRARARGRPGGRRQTGEPPPAGPWVNTDVLEAARAVPLRECLPAFESAYEQSQNGRQRVLRQRGAAAHALRLRPARRQPAALLHRGLAARRRRSRDAPRVRVLVADSNTLQRGRTTRAQGLQRTPRRRPRGRAAGALDREPAPHRARRRLDDGRHAPSGLHAARPARSSCSAAASAGTATSRRLKEQLWPAFGLEGPRAAPEIAPDLVLRGPQPLLRAHAAARRHGIPVGRRPRPSGTSSPAAAARRSTGSSRCTSGSRPAGRSTTSCTCGCAGTRRSSGRSTTTARCATRAASGAARPATAASAAAPTTARSWSASPCPWTPAPAPRRP